MLYAESDALRKQQLLADAQQAVNPNFYTGQQIVEALDHLREFVRRSDPSYERRPGEAQKVQFPEDYVRMANTLFEIMRRPSIHGQMHGLREFPAFMTQWPA